MDAYQKPAEEENLQAIPRRHDERRRYVRRYFSVPIRYMMCDKIEHSGTLENISAGGICVQADLLPEIGDKIILYIDYIGRFEGDVVRLSDTFFIVHMKLSTAKSDRLKASLETFFLSDAPNASVSDRRIGIIERRSDQRLARNNDDKVIGAAAGDAPFQCAVINISLGGIEIRTKASLDLGESVTIGMVEGIVTRRTQEGYVILREA